MGRCYGWGVSNSSSSNDFGRFIITDDQFNVYVTGSFRDTIDFDFSSGTNSAISNGGFDIFIQKLDFAGNLIWAKTIGGSNVDEGRDIKLDASGNIYVTGFFKDTVDFDPGIGTFFLDGIGWNYAAFILKLDNNGNFIWAKKISSSNSVTPTQLDLDSLNNIYLTGYFWGTADFNPGSGFSTHSSTGWSDVFVEKLDSNGSFIWVNTFGGIHIDEGKSIKVDKWGNVFVTGTFRDTVDFDSGPNTDYLSSNGSNDVFVQKLNTSGSLLWTKSFGGLGQLDAEDLAIDSLSNVYVTGTFWGTADFDPGSGFSFKTSYPSSFSSYLQKLDSSGSFQWVNTLSLIYSKGMNVTIGEDGGLYYVFGNGSPTSIQKLNYSGTLIWTDVINGIATRRLHVDNQENIYATGIFSGTQDFDPGSDTYYLTSNASFDVFVLKLGNCTPSYDTVNISTCNSYSWIDGNTYYADTNLSTSIQIPNQSGCDSVINLNLSITPNDTLIQTISRCDSLLWIDGNVYWQSTNSPSYIVGGALANGCDSVYLLNLSINSTDSTAHIISCDSLTWIDGSTYTSSNNTAFVTYTNALGCDSTIWLDLFIPDNTPTTDVVVACNSYTWINGVTYTTNNTLARDTLTNSFGCDSIIILDLTIGHQPSSPTIDTIVSCYAITWINGTTYYSSNNTVTHTLTNATGCDSVVTLNLTINPNSYGVTTIHACDSLVWTNGITYYTTTYGIYDTLTGASATGCDSIVITNFIESSNQMVDVVNACDTYTWINGTTYTASNNSDSVTYTNSHGCDSTITLDLTINYSSIGTTDTIVSCGSYTWMDGNTYTVNNTTAKDTLTNSAGCDSVVTLNLTVNPTSATSSTVAACGSYAWATTGIAYYSSGTYKDTLVNTVGCDSIVTLNLTINPIYSLTETYTACDRFTWSNGITYTTSNNTAVQNLTSVSGCDSTISLDLTINHSNSQTDNITACGNYTWIDGITYTASNSTASMTLTNATGCDSVVTLNLTLNVADTSVTRQDLTLTANASSGSFQWLDCANNYAVISGETSANYTVTQSGSYALEVTLNGCIDTSSCYVFTNVSVNDISVNKDIRIYPNPTANFITIDLQKVNASKAKITIVDFAGHTVYQESIAKDSSPWTKQVDMSNFASGVYFVKVAIGGDEFVYQVSRL